MAKAKRKKATRKKAVKKKVVKINYIKTPSYRSYHADGAYGGVTPKGNIYCEFFIDRNVTPQVVEHALSSDGIIGAVKKTYGKEGIVRQIECGISMDIATAISFRDWLDDKIKRRQAVVAK